MFYLNSASVEFAADRSSVKSALLNKGKLFSKIIIKGIIFFLKIVYAGFRFYTCM